MSGKTSSNDSSRQTSQQIFISYAREDLGLARQLNQDLRARCYDTWIDFENLIPGQAWKTAITSAIRKSGYFLFLMSSRSLNKRGYIQKEVRQALDVLEYVPPGAIYLIPVRCDECTPTDPNLCEHHWVDLFPSYEDGLLTLLRAFAPPEKVSLHPFCIIIEALGTESSCHKILTELPATFGFSDICDFQLASDAASRRHAVLFKEQEQLFIADLGSTNGTFVKESRISSKFPLDLREPTSVRFGDLEFQLNLCLLDSEAPRWTEPIRE